MLSVAIQSFYWLSVHDPVLESGEQAVYVICGYMRFYGSYT